MNSLYPLSTNTNSVQLIRENYFSSGNLFVLANTPITNSERVFVQSILRKPTTEYSLAANSLLLFTAASSNTAISVFYEIVGAQPHLRTITDTWKIQASESVFELEYPSYSNLEEVYLQGELMYPGYDYTLIGTTLTWLRPLPINTYIIVHYRTEWS